MKGGRSPVGDDLIYRNLQHLAVRRRRRQVEVAP